MTTQLTAEAAIQDEREVVEFPLRAWVWANAFGLGIAFALFGLFGGIPEVMGADHDSVARNVPAVIGMVAGGTVFALLRRRALGARLAGSRWRALGVGIGLTAGFLLGLVAPLDFILGIVAAGSIGAALQLSGLRRRPATSRGLLLVGLGAWLTAAVAAVAAAILVGDVILAGAIGGGDEHEGIAGVAGFTGMLLLLGLVAGAVGGAIEGAALRRRIGRPA